MKKIDIKGLDEVIFYEKTDSGLPVYMWQNTQKSNYYISLAVKFGSIHTDYKIGSKVFHTPKGLAHYLEHLKFNEKDGSSANDFFEASGNSSNAFTTFEYTNYEVEGTTCFGENLNHLLDFVYTPYFSNKLVNKERGIITEEIKMGMDNPRNDMFFKFFDNIFTDYNYRYEIAGTVDDIKKITVQDIQEAYDTFYHPENMFLVVTGNFNPYEVIEIVNNNLKDKEFKPFKKITFINKNELTKVNIANREIKGNVTIPKVKIGVKLKKSLFKEHDDDTVLVILSIILRANFGKTSDFYEYLKMNQLIEYLSPDRAVYQDYIILSVAFESKCPNEAIKLIIDKFHNLEITEEILNRRRKSNYACLVNDYDDVISINTIIQNDIIDKNRVLDNIYEIYNSIDLDKATKVLKKIKITDSNLSVLKLIPKEKVID